MSLEQQVANLTTATTSLLDAVNVRKTTLDERVETAGDFANAAQMSANAAAASVTDANQAAGEAAGSAAQALAIYGTAAAQQSAVIAAQAAASLAEGYAAAASSVAQQDLSGVTAAALHRSPNAVTAMFVYDTSKDSDGGAWTEKCQHTSWYNEELCGKWLGAHASEALARAVGGVLGPELVITPYSGTAVGGFSSTGDSLVRNGGDSRFSLTINSPAIIGRFYKVTFNVSGFSGDDLIVRIGDTSGAFSSLRGNGQKSLIISAVGGSSILYFAGVSANIGTATITNISVREVVAQTTQPGDYFQLTTDGKFYRLWKNLLSYSQSFDNAYWDRYSSSVNVSPNIDIAPDGTTTADKIIPSAAAGIHIIRRTDSPASNNTFSVYAKAAGYNWINIGGWSNGCYFDLQNGVIGANGVVSASITNVGNGWYRCSVTLGAQGGAGVNIYVASANSTSSFTGDGTSGVLLWGAQLEYGSVATAYEAKGADGSITEVFRGNKRDFPRLAGIVAEASNVTIYDLTETGRPMWMRFVRGTSGSTVTHLGVLSASVGGIAAASGVVAITCGSQGLVREDFVKEINSYKTNAVSTTRFGNIAQRNVEYSSHGINDGGNGIASATVNAVAMTVLPDAPVDPVTELKVPTIAVATNGGASVIQHSGVVVNSAQIHVYMDVELTKDILVVARNYAAERYYALNPGALGASFVMVGAYVAPPDFHRGSNITDGLIGLPRSEMMRRSATAATVQKLKNNESTPVRGIAATITNTFNTGHQTGDIRRTYLADNVAESVGPSTELVTNGTFDTDSGWTKTGSATISSGACQLGNGSAGVVYQDITFVPGKSYRVTITVAYTTGRCEIDTTTSGGTRVDYLSIPPTTGTTTFLFTAQGSAARLRISTRDSSVPVVSIDNISVKKVVGDRSYKAQGANIVGTLVKSAVASAAELVAYSGFSASNYLQEPYSADLDFGTGEWSVGAWVNVPVTLPVESFPVLGPELVTNGTFDTDTDWTKGAGWTISGGVAYKSPGSTAQLTQNVLFKDDTTYRVTVDVTLVSSTCVIELKGSGAGGVSRVINTSGVSTFYIKTATSVVGTKQVAFAVQTSTAEYSVNNISVREVAPALIADRAHSGGAKLLLGVTGTGNLTATAYDGTTTRTVTTTAAYNTATWIKPEACYTTDGTLSIRVNGVEVAVTRGNPLLTLNNSNAVLTIGNSYALNAPFPGSVALLKLSATVPTQEQSVWMYEQEKQMFREGAQCCLPDSGTIVGLAYDDATDKWIAVSAANESEWSGLVRTSVTPVPAGSYTKVAAASGVQLLARSTTNPGVDITIPAYGLREELVKRAEAAAQRSKEIVTFDFDAAEGQSKFALPVGYATKAVYVDGAAKRLGNTKDFTLLFDGFKETVAFAVAPAPAAWVQIHAIKD